MFAVSAGGHTTTSPPKSYNVNDGILRLQASAAATGASQRPPLLSKSTFSNGKNVTTNSTKNPRVLRHLLVDIDSRVGA